MKAAGVGLTRWSPALLGLVALCSTLAAPAAPKPAQEPGSMTSMAARLVAVSPAADGAVARVELRTWSHGSLPAGLIRITGSSSSGKSADLELPVHKLHGNGDSEVRLTDDIFIPGAQDWQLTFALTGEDEGRILASTTLGVNLDPATRPREVDGRLEFKAQGSRPVMP